MLFFLPLAIWLCPVVSAAMTPSAPQPLFLPVPAQSVFDADSITVALPLEVRVTPPVRWLRHHRDERVSAALSRVAHDLSNRFVSQGLAVPKSGDVRAVELSWDAPASGKEGWQEDESYDLTLQRDKIVLHAAKPLGVVRGLETLKQWIGVQDGQLVARLGEVYDAPRFVWRGLMLDVARHFVPAEQVKRHLDAMASVKLNVFHWHLSDDQGFRYESKVAPLLQREGSDGSYYTQREIRDVVAHARRLGIRVVPEVDMPGHTTSWLVGYPHLGSRPGPYTLPQHWGILDAVLDPSQEATYAFVDRLLGELASLFTDEFIHIGGDEVKDGDWQSNTQVAALMKREGLKTFKEVHDYFVVRVARLAARHKRRVVGWDEILAPKLPEGCVIQSWQGPSGVKEAVAMGHSAILSHGFYLNAVAAASEHYLNDPTHGVAKHELPQMLGGEACQWTELTPAHLLDAWLWPRSAAIAERLWSPADVADVDDMYARLNLTSERLASLGIHTTGPWERFLKRVDDTPGRQALEVLAEVLEAFRANWWPRFTHRRELDGFGDALFPESAGARSLHRSVKELLESSVQPEDHFVPLRGHLSRLAQNHGPIIKLVAQNPELEDALVASQALTEVAELGLEALTYLESKTRATTEWRVAAERILAQEELRDVGIRVALVPAVRLLVEQAAPTP